MSTFKQKSPSLQIKNLLCNDLDTDATIPFIQLPNPAQGMPKTYHQENPFESSIRISSIPCNKFDLYQYQCYQHDKSFFKIKRRRATVLQTQALQKVFENTAFPSTGLRENLAHHLGMSPRTVQIWFQNKRQAARKVYK